MLAKKGSALDALLAFALVTPLAIVPGWFFGRAEASRMAVQYDQWRGLAVAESQEKDAGQVFTFYLQAGGVDEFGIARAQSLIVRDHLGRLLEPDEERDSRLREVAARLRKGLEKECQAFEDLLICALLKGSDVAGAALKPTTVSLPILGPCLAVLVGALLVYLLARQGELKRPVVSLVASIVGLSCALLVANGVDTFRGVLEAEGARIIASSPLDLPLPNTNAFFVAIVTFASLALCALLFPHAQALFANLRSRPFIYAAIAPAIIGMFVLVFIPFFMGVYLAFLDNKGEFVGLANFAEILFPTEQSDTNFYFTLGVTVMWTVLNVGLHVIIGLALAVILSDANLRGRSIYRVLLIVPWAVPNYITALVWKWIFNTQYGPTNAFLALLGFEPVDWLGRSFWTNFFANLVTNTWLGFPFMMVISLGALQSIPGELYEAAKIDGAGRFATFRHITLPLLKPALFPAIILGTVWTFNMFNVVYLVSGGAPDNKTNILITEAYRAFRVLKNYGLAAAYSLIIFVILAVYTALTNRIARAAESVYE